VVTRESKSIHSNSADITIALALGTMSTSTASSTTSSKSNASATMGGQVKRKIINVSPMYFSLAVTFAHVLLSPYTKVEESFTLHAVHDVLAYGQWPKELSRVSLALLAAVM
jgi:hypothetical protein